MQMQRYAGRISGPLLDRIDIHIDVPAVKFRELVGDTHPETDSSSTISYRVIAAGERQLNRFKGEKIFSISAMSPRMIRRHCRTYWTSSNANSSLHSPLTISLPRWRRLRFHPRLLLGGGEKDRWRGDVESSRVSAVRHASGQ